MPENTPVAVPGCARCGERHTTNCGWKGCPNPEASADNPIPRLVIVMDPKRGFGRPTVDGTRLSVSYLLQRIRAELADGRDAQAVRRMLREDYESIPAEAWPVLEALAEEMAGEEHPDRVRLDPWLDAAIAFADDFSPVSEREREALGYLSLALARLSPRAADLLTVPLAAGPPSEPKGASPEEPDEDAMTMTCGHPGRSWSSVWKRCMECP